MPKRKLVKMEPGWAINGRGTKVILANWSVQIDGVEIGQVYQVLSCRKIWKARSGDRWSDSLYSREDAIRFVERAAKGRQA